MTQASLTHASSLPKAARVERPSGRGPRFSRMFTLERIVMGAAIAALFVLVVLPLCFLLVASIWSEGRFTLEHFREALSGRLYLQALLNSLMLGAWTGLFSLLLGLPMAWAVARTNVPGKGLITLTANLSYLSPPFLTAIAFVNLFGTNAGLVNVFFREVVGAPWLGFNIFSMPGLVLVTVLHTFPYVFLLASSALQSVDASY